MTCLNLTQHAKLSPCTNSITQEAQIETVIIIFILDAHNWNQVALMPPQQGSIITSKKQGDLEVHF